MSTARLDSMVSRITPFEAVNIDGILEANDPRTCAGGNDIFPSGVGKSAFRPLFRSESTVTIGIRISIKRDDLAILAGQLAALCMEKDVEVIVLSTLDYSGLERFGFRSERICGETPEQLMACELQLVRFWNLEVII